MHGSPGCIADEPWSARVHEVELVHLSGVSYGFIAMPPASSSTAHADLGMPALTQACSVACSAAVGTAAGFGGITPDFISEIDRAPTFWVGSVVAVATKFS